MQRQASGSTTFLPITELDERTTHHDSGNVSECGSNGYGQHVERTGSPPGDADQHRAPSRNGSGSGGGSSNGGSNGSSGGSTGGNGSPPLNGYGKAPAKSQTVSFDQNVKGAPASSGSTTGSSSTGPTAQTSSEATSASSQQGVDEVDKSGKAKTSPKQTPATPPASGGAAARPTKV